MRLKMHILKEVEMYMVVCHTMQLAFFIEVTCKIIDPLPATVQPHIHITRSAQLGSWIVPSNGSTFQQRTGKSMFLKKPYGFRTCFCQ